MRKAVLIEKGGDLIALAAEKLLAAGDDMSRSLVIFPGRRPSHFLQRELARALKRPYLAPQVYSIDDWVDASYERLEKSRSRVGEIDALGLLYELHKEKGMPGSQEANLTLDEFIPWGYRLFSAFEELYIEGVKPESLAALDVLAQEKLPPRIRGAFEGLAEFYQAFYARIETGASSTRSTRYRLLSERCQNLELAEYPVILLIGFFALTFSEKRIFRELLEHDGSLMLLQDGSGITAMLEELDIQFESDIHPGSSPRITYYKSPDVHGEVMKLNQIVGHNVGEESQAIVLPSSRALFPVVQNTLPVLGDDWNISMGFPLQATPIYSLLSLLARALESRADGNYFVPDYLRLVLHPYVKNLYLEGASYPTRILFHTVEETLSAYGSRFARLAEIEEDETVLGMTVRRFRGAAIRGVEERDLVQHIRGIHDVLLRPFESVESIGDFCARVLDLVSHISMKSPANRHPFTARFMESLIQTVGELRFSSVASYGLENSLNYFALLNSYTSRLHVPLPGTPLKGLQVLGLLETRNLGFRKLYVLDANEGELPASRREDPFLPVLLRRELGLPTYTETSRIEAYYFENLVAAADDVHIFYQESEEHEKSRFVEQLIWDEQKKTGTLDRPRHEVIIFASKFGQTSPGPVKKSDRVLELIRSKPFSASSLDLYLQCPLSFFYLYGLKLEEKAGIGEQIEPRNIGRLVHRIMKDLLSPKKGRPLTITRSDFESASRLVDRVFREEYGESQHGAIHLSKLQIKARLPAILEYHRKKLQGSVILECEEMHVSRLDLPDLDEVAIKGKIDRIDRRGDRIVIVDYKTGSTLSKPTKKFSLDAREDWHKTLSSVQLPLYMMLYSREHPELDVTQLDSGFMSLGTRPIEELYLIDTGDDRAQLYETYAEAIRRLIAEILDPDTDFTDSPDPDKYCPSCPYRVICGRQWVVRSW